MVKVRVLATPWKTIFLFFFPMVSTSVNPVSIPIPWADNRPYWNLRLTDINWEKISFTASLLNSL